MKNETIIYAGMFELPDEDAAAHRVHGIGKILIELGYKVIFIGFSKRRNLREFNTESCTYLAMKKPESTKEWIELQTSASLLKKTIKNTHNVRGVILYNFPSLPFEGVRHICTTKKIPIYADCTEWHHDDRGVRLAWLKNLETYKRIRFDDFRVDGLIVISSFLEKYYSKKRTIKIPPIFDYMETRLCDTHAYADKTVFVFTGTISAQKENVVSMVKAAKELEEEGYNIELKIYGVSLEEYKKNTDMDVSVTNIHFYGRVQHEQCIKAIQDADFQVFFREITRVNMAGFPTKFAESFSCGTPVITSYTSDIPEYLKDGKTGFVVVDGNVKEAMKRACSCTKEEKEKLRDNVLKEKRFDYREYIESLDKFLI